MLIFLRTLNGAENNLNYLFKKEGGDRIKKEVPANFPIFLKIKCNRFPIA
jgi:hypothetical protein